MLRIFRLIVISTVMAMALFSALFLHHVDHELNPAFIRVVRNNLWASIGLVVFLTIIDYYYRRLANQLRDSQLYYNQLKAKMETEMAYSEVFGKINELTEVFSNTHDLEAVLNETVRTLRHVLKAGIISLQLYSDEEDRFFMRIDEGGTDIDLGDDIKTDVIEKGRSRLINELDAFKDYPELRREGFKSLIVAPLTKVKPETGRVSIGLIAALTRERRDFTSHDLGLLNAFTRHASLIIQNAQLYVKTQELAIRDGLTNLFNRRHFNEKIERVVKTAVEKSQRLSMLIGDIDNFKSYNDTYGHPQGDVILREISTLMLDHTRGSDFVARYGGEEFVIILPDTDREGTLQLGKIMMNKIRDHEFPHDETQPLGHITMTFGGATFPDEVTDATGLINLADQRLYKGKNSGKNKIVME